MENGLHHLLFNFMCVFDVCLCVYISIFRKPNYSHIHIVPTILHIYIVYRTCERPKWAIIRLNVHGWIISCDFSFHFVFTELFIFHLILVYREFGTICFSFWRKMRAKKKVEEEEERRTWNLFSAKWKIHVRCVTQSSAKKKNGGTTAARRGERKNKENSFNYLFSALFFFLSAAAVAEQCHFCRIKFVSNFIFYSNHLF